MQLRALPALVLVGVCIAVGHALLRALGVDTSPDALRGSIVGVGWWSPAAYVALISVRHFLLLPSTVMLTVGGGLFGVGLGTAAGGLGLLLSGLIEFWLFRVLKPRRLIARMEQRAEAASDLAGRGTPLAVFVSTALPPMPMTLFYWAASLTRIGFAHFAALIAPSGFVRALILSLLGAGLIRSDWRLALGALAVLALGLAASMRSPRLRAALLPPSSA